MANFKSRASDNYSPWTVGRWLCTEAPGALVLADSSPCGNDLSPNFAPVWKPSFNVGTASYLNCMRPATPWNSGVLLEPTTVTAITSATEPAWNLTPGTTTVDGGVTWTARAAAITLDAVISSPRLGVSAGLGGHVCFPRFGRSQFDRVMGFTTRSDWTYTANTLSFSASAIDDSANAIPAGLVVGDLVLATGSSNADNQMFGSVTSISASSVGISGGFITVESAGAMVTLRRVHLPWTVVLSAWVTPTTASAFTNDAYLMRAATRYGVNAGNGGGTISVRVRNDGSRRALQTIVSPGGNALNTTQAGNMGLNVPTHVCCTWDRLAGTQTIALDGVSSAVGTFLKNHKCILREPDDATWLARGFALDFFAGDAGKASFRDVQLYAGPLLPPGADVRWPDLIVKMKNGGYLSVGDWS